MLLESGPESIGLNHKTVDFITKIKELSPSEDWVVDIVTASSLLWWSLSR